MDEELKPCPFCGGRAHVWKCEPYIHRYPNFHYCVVCNDCDLLFGFDEDYGGIFETEKEALEAWNKRTCPEWMNGEALC